MQHICTEPHDFDLTHKHRRHSGRRTSHNRSDRQPWRSDRQLNTGRTARSGGRTASPGLSQFLSLEKPKPTGIFKPIELLPGDSKNYETKCSRITLPSYTLYFWPSSNLTKFTSPVRPPTNGRSDRQPVGPPEWPVGPPLT